MNFSKITVLGRIGDIKEKESKMSFSVAENISKDETTWYRCYLSQRQTEYFKEKLTVGDVIYVEGKLRALTNSKTNEPLLRIFTSEIRRVVRNKKSITYTTSDIPF